MPTVYCWDEIDMYVNGQPLPEGKLVPAVMAAEILTFAEMQKALERLERLEHYASFAEMQKALERLERLEHYAFDCDSGDEISFSTQMPRWKMARLKNMGWKKRRRWQPVQWVLRHDRGLYARRIVKVYQPNREE